MTFPNTKWCDSEPPPLTPNSVTDAWKTYSVILITPLLTEDNSCLMAELQWGVLTPIIWPKGLPELIITAADSALGLCTSQHITEPWLTGDSAYDRLGDAVLKWAADVVSLSCMCGQRTADRITCRSSIPRALKAFSHPTGDKCLSHSNTHPYTLTPILQCHRRERRIHSRVHVNK